MSRARYTRKTTETPPRTPYVSSDWHATMTQGERRCKCPCRMGLMRARARSRVRSTCGTSKRKRKRGNLYDSEDAANLLMEQLADLHHSFLCTFSYLLDNSGVRVSSFPDRRRGRGKGKLCESHRSQQGIMHHTSCTSQGVFRLRTSGKLNPNMTEISTEIEDRGCMSAS